MRCRQNGAGRTSISAAVDRATVASIAFVACVAALAATGCRPAPPEPSVPANASEWREFTGTWTAAGNRYVIALGMDRKASVATLKGSLVLSGPSRPNAGYRAEVVVFNDSATGMVGRAVWTDERGDQAWSELRGEGTATGNRIVGTFVAGTGRYAGISGDYEFAWRFVLEGEDGVVQGQSEGLKGRVRIGPAEKGRQ
ncbi:MAG: hypothetical protein WBA53_16020 [Burkholderiaceae bacterium]